MGMEPRGSARRLTDSNSSSLNGSIEQAKSDSMNSSGRNRSKQRSSTTTNLSLKVLKPSLFTKSKENRNQTNHTDLVANENQANHEKNGTKKHILKKSSTTKDTKVTKDSKDTKDTEKTLRTKTLKKSVFNPDNYEETYDANELMRKVERVNKKRRTMMGLPPMNKLAQNVAEKERSSSSSSSPSPSSSGFISNSGSIMEIKTVQMVSSNPTSANKKTEERHMSVVKGRNEQLRPSVSRDSQKLQGNADMKDDTTHNTTSQNMQVDTPDPLISKEDKGIEAEVNDVKAPEENEDIDFGAEETENPNFSRFLKPMRMATREKRNWRLRKDPEYMHLKWIFFPDDPSRMTWDVIIIAILLYITWVLPLRIAAYIDDSGVGWLISDWILNGFFAIDIVVNVFSAYFDQDLNLVTSRRKILLNYLFGWCLIDVAAIIPFDQILETESSYQQLLRVARLPRLYKLLKILKMLKIIKERAVILKFIQEMFHLTPQVERLLISFFIILIFVNLSACAWKFILDFYSYEPNSWFKVHGFYDADGNLITTELDLYIASSYLVVQTIVTVGYGDLAAGTDVERIICCFWMFIGVFLYSFLIGSLASLVSRMDTDQAKYSQKLNVLLQLKKDYKFDTRLYLKIKNALRYGITQHQDNQEFLKELPQNLRHDLSSIIYQDILNSIPFFADKPKSFISIIAPVLRPIKIAKGETVFLQGDPADEMFFIKSGEVAYVIPKYFDFKFLKIKQGYYFGETDLLFYGEIRKYTLKAVKTCEFYVLNKKDFKHIFFMEFRDVGMEIITHAYKRKLRTKKAYKEAITSLTKGGGQDLNNYSKQLKHKLTVYQEDVIEDLDEEIFDTDSEEEVETRAANELFPGLKIHLENNQLGQIDELLEEEVTTTAKTLTNKQALTSKQAQRLSKFFEPSLFHGFGDVVAQENSPVNLLLEKSLQSNSKKKPEVKEINHKVDKIEDKLNSLLSMSMRLEEGLKTYNDTNQRSPKKSNTYKEESAEVPKPKKVKQRNSVSYSTQEDLLDQLKKSKIATKKISRSSSSKSNNSKKNSQIMNSSNTQDKIPENDDKDREKISEKDVEKDKAKENEKMLVRTDKVETHLFKRSNFQQWKSKPVNDEWESINEDDKSPI